MGSRGCPHRAPKPEWAQSSLVFTCIKRHPGYQESLVEGGELRGELVLLALMTGFEPQWRESYKSFYF